MLEALVSSTEESASFWIPHGGKRMGLYRIHSPRTARSHVDEGERSPLNRGSGGHIVAFYLRHSTPMASDMEKEGVIATVGDRDPDVASDAAPVLGAPSRILGALVLAGIRLTKSPWVGLRVCMS